MRSKYVAPAKDAKQFHCIHCGAYAHQDWNPLHLHTETMRATSFSGSSCAHCGNITFWYGERIIVPSEAPVEPAHPDLPEALKPDFDEARGIVARSPRAAAALLRVLIQKLMPDPGQKGENLNEDIRNLVAAGLPASVQQALDHCRVVGNNAVHPGEIDLNDTPEIAHQLFAMVNFIVDDRITRPREIAALYESSARASLGGKQASSRSIKQLGGVGSRTSARPSLDCHRSRTHSLPATASDREHRAL